MSMYGKDNVVSKALTLIGKLQHKYGFKPKFYDLVEYSPEKEELPTIFEEESSKEEPPGGDTTEDGDWCLVSCHGNIHRLPKTMIFLGREECDIEVQSETVDKRHAVVTFDHYLRRFKIKDLSTANGTYVNKERIPEQEYVILDQQDSLYLGNDDSITFHMERFENQPTTEQEGETIFSPNINDELPPWANTSNVTEELQSPMAECQGCIVEQRIEHTCNENNLETESAHKDLDRSYSHDSIASFGLGCNTWPKKRYKAKTKTAVHEIFGDMDEERSLNFDGLIDTPPSRVLRGTGAPMNKLPDELATVKKGTPLYGQPEWWGEDDSDLNIEKLRSNGSSMEQVSSKEPSSKTDQSGTSVSNNTSDTKIENTDTVNNVPNNNVNTADNASGSGNIRSPEGITNMAFTVDFGDESKPQLEGKSIGDFMPSKLRKSFRERMEKNSEKSASTKSVSKEKTTLDKTNTSKVMGRAVSEGRDVSHQSKLDDLWNSSTPSTPESVTSKRQKMMTKTSSSSSKSIDDEHNESYSKGTKSSSVKRRAPLSSSNSKAKSVIRARKAVSQEILASSTQFASDNTSYLIDKMFQNNSTGSVDSLRTNGAITVATEHEMYHESVKYGADHSLRTNNSKDVLSVNTKLEIVEKTDKKVRSKEVPATIFKKSIEDYSPEKEEDKVSEAGTYTIEDDKDSKEEDEARKNIDKVFGVDQINMTGSDNLTDDLKKKITKPDKQGELTLNLQNLNLELEEIERLEKLRSRHQMADSMEAELGSAESREYVETNGNANVPLDAPKWVTQWAALTNQKSQSKSDMELSSPGSSISDESKSSGKATNGLSRKRPGTGRKLPTIPPGASSPTSSEKSGTKGSPIISNRSDLTVNGTSLQTTPQNDVKLSSHILANQDDVDVESMSWTQRSDGLDTGRDLDSYKKSGSNASVASLDTEVLLKDTRTVMTAIEKRIGSKPSVDDHVVPTEDSEKYNGNNSSEFFYHSSKNGTDRSVLDDSVDAESDTSSVVALVNGDEDFIKPSLYKSPREALGRGKLKLTESLPSKPSLKFSGAKSRTLSSEKERKSSREESKAVSDIFSDVNGTSRTDDLDTSEYGQFNRQGSKGKGQMSMTRPNRAFALRRARADGDDPLDTSRSSTTSVTTASSGFKTPRGGSMTNLSKTSGSSTPQKPKRPMSGVLSDRQAPDSQRSQASLGAQIVQKSRENVNFNRVDGGRHSLRMARSMSIPTQQQQPQQSTPSKSRRSDGSSSIQHSKSLRVTGVSARERSSSVSKTGGGQSNSPKSAERNAWKRRKEYDPRRAVAEAKTKQKDPKSRRSDGMDVFNKTRGVTRSASFTNARDLKLSSYKCDSTSSTEEYSRRSSGASDVFDEPKRGFVPYSVRSLMSSKVSNSSADEDDMDRSARSSSAQSSQASKTLPNHQSNPATLSAFTPPPKPTSGSIPLSVYKPVPRSRSSTRSSRAKFSLKTPSPTPASSINVSVHRRSVDSLQLYQNAIGRKAKAKVETPPIPVPESYDTLIVSSIYQLSLKLKTQTDKTMEKLRDTEMIENGLESPLDDLDNQTAVSEIPAYKSANQELAGVLKNLRKLEQHIKVINKVLFPDYDGSPDTSKEKHEYMQEIERIKNELAGFQPIETPRDDIWKQAETASVESDCEELSHAEYY